MTLQKTPSKTDYIQQLIEKKRAFNEAYGFGYSIQIYYGNEKDARKVLSSFRHYFRDVKSRLLYEKPDWKVHVGNYKTTLEADKAIERFKEFFPNIIAIPLNK